MKIRIITDSATDLPQDYNENVTVLPMSILIDGVTYKDGIDLSHAEFYEKLQQAEELPKTSQVAPFDFECAYQKAVDQGEKVLVITISSKLSGTYQSAMIAAENFRDHVRIIDSENVSVGEKALVERACQLLQKDEEWETMVQILEQEKKNLHIVALLDTLEYLKKGGRISSTTAAVGGILSIKPVVGVVDGEIVLLGKSRGSKNGHNLLIQQMDKFGGIDFSMPYFLGYTGNEDSLIQKYIQDSQAVWMGKTENVEYSTIGATIGTHVGPGAIAIAFFGNNK